VEALISNVVETYGRPDCAHNNAGISGTGIAGAQRALTVEYAEERWHQVSAVNLTGVWLCMKYEIAQMFTQGSSAIVNTAISGIAFSLGACAAINWETPSKTP
jgi:NAD(P)-dependent dehydrogenase (short-subunit alcohol dehydrogenase family)